MDKPLTTADALLLTQTFQDMINQLEQKIDSMVDYRAKYEDLKSSISGKLLSQKQAAEMCGISSSTILRARQAKRIKAVLVGKTWKYNMNEVLKYKSKFY